MDEHEQKSHVLWGESDYLKTLDDCLDEAAKTAAHKYGSISIHRKSPRMNCFNNNLL
jgi:hypothetical protein